MQIGDLVRIRQSFSQSKVGKLAIVVDRWCAWNVTIHIIDTGEEQEYHIKKLEVMKVGTLVRIRQSNIGDKGRFAIVVKMYPNDAVLHVVDTGEVWRYALYNLEVLCK